LSFVLFRRLIAGRLARLAGAGAAVAWRGIVLRGILVLRRVLALGSVFFRILLHGLLVALRSLVVLGLHVFGELAGVVGDLLLTVGETLHVSSARGLPLQLAFFINEFGDAANLLLQPGPLVLQAFVAFFAQQ
jgi:hypothetical protein